MTTQDQLALGLDHGMPAADWGNCASYAMLRQTWRDPRPIPSETQILEWFSQSSSSAQATRAKTRSGLRAQWEGLPPWVRGPYQSLFTAAKDLLDAGEDDAAAEMTRLAPPMPGYTPEQLATFLEDRGRFAAAVSAL